MSKVGSIELEGILNAWTTKLRTTNAMSAAMISDSKYSLHLLFILPELFITNSRLSGLSQSIWSILSILSNSFLWFLWLIW